MNCSVRAGPAMARPRVIGTGPRIWVSRPLMLHSSADAVALPTLASPSKSALSGRTMSGVCVMNTSVSRVQDAYPGGVSPGWKILAVEKSGSGARGAKAAIGHGQQRIAPHQKRDDTESAGNRPTEEGRDVALGLQDAVHEVLFHDPSKNQPQHQRAGGIIVGVEDQHQNTDDQQEPQVEQ